MAHGEVSEVIPASAAEVFELLHDYGRRLSWDTLLSAAYLDDGFTEAGKGVTSVCVGRRSLGSLALRTVHPAHRPVTGRVARHVHLPVHGAPRLAAVGAGANHGGRVPLGDPQAAARAPQSFRRAAGRLKPELQTGRAQRMAGLPRYT